MEVVAEDLPDAAVVGFDFSAIDRGYTQPLEADALRIKHPENVMIGDQKQIRRCSQIEIGIGESARIDVAVGTD